MSLAKSIISSNEYSLDSILSLCAQGCTVAEISRDLNINPRSVRYHMKKRNIFPRKGETISDEQLDERVAQIIEKYPELGHTLLQAFYFVAHPSPVPRQRLRDSLNRVRIHRNAPPRLAIKRRVYTVKAPLSVVHIDGHHKLNRYGFVTHCGIDGYSRLIFFMKISNNNKARTVLAHFKEGVKKYGLPSKIRTDHGMENVSIADYMLAARDKELGISVITGRSVHNQRVERLWRDVFQSAIWPYYLLFHSMEDQHILNPSSEIDIFCLHTICKVLLTSTVDGFQSGWNRHKIRTMKNRSPNVLFMKGLIKLKNTPGYHSELNQDQNDIEFADYEAQLMQNAVDEIDDPDRLVDIPPFHSPLSNAEEMILHNYFDPSSVDLENLPQKYLLLKGWVSQCIEQRL